MIFCSPSDFFLIKFFKILFQEYHQIVKQMDPGQIQYFTSLVGVQNVKKDYQQSAIKVVASRLRVIVYQGQIRI